MSGVQSTMDIVTRITSSMVPRRRAGLLPHSVSLLDLGGVVAAAHRAGVSLLGDLASDRNVLRAGSNRYVTVEIDLGKSVGVQQIRVMSAPCGSSPVDHLSCQPRARGDGGADRIAVGGGTGCRWTAGRGRPFLHTLLARTARRTCSAVRSPAESSMLSATSSD